jgi:hypothetical protein
MSCNYKFYNRDGVYFISFAGEKGILDNVIIIK